MAGVLCQLRQRLPESCAKCGKRQMDDGVKLLSCGRCCSQWYCGKACQVEAWQGGHKKECYSMASEALTKAVDSMGGCSAVNRNIWTWLLERQNGEGFSPEQEEIIKVLLPLSRTTAKTWPFPLNIYAMSLIARGVMTLHHASKTQEKDLAGLERAAVELEEADAKFGHILQSCMPEQQMFLHLAVLRLRARTGDHEKAIARGRAVLPSIERVVTLGNVQYARRAASYMAELSQEISAHAFKVEASGIKSIGTKEDEGGEGWAAACMLSDYAGLSKEAAVLAKRALALTEGTGIQGSALVFYLAHVTEVLEAGRSINEAVTYSQRMYELADRDDAIPAARIHGRLLVRLGRCTEAMEILRRGLELLADLDPCEMGQNDEAQMHMRLGQILLKQGHVEEALRHAMHARAVHPPVTPPCPCTYISDVYALGADALERLGRYDEAMEWDAQGYEFTGIMSHSFDRRRLEYLLATGHTEQAMYLMRGTLRGVLIGREVISVTSLPEEEDNRRLDLYAEMLEATTDPEDLRLAASLRADVAENRAILTALQEAVLVQTREEAALVAHKAREERAAWLGTAARGSTGRKRGKQRGKGKRKGTKGSKATEGPTRPSPLRAEDREDPQAQGQPHTGEDERRVEEQVECEAHLGEVAVGEDDEKDEECAICFLDFEGDEEAEVVLLCGHRFHAACVDLWGDNCRGKGLTVTCPMCRAELQH